MIGIARRVTGRASWIAAAGVAASLAVGSMGAAGVALAAGEAVDLPSVDWSFTGIFGRFDNNQLQRGYQVYANVCAGCHAVKYLYYRDLKGIGYTVDDVKAIAASAIVPGGLDEFGDPVEREAIPADRFAKPFPNEVAARAANGGAYPPDLSILAKARPNGSNHIYGVLIGYPGDGLEVPADKAGEVQLGVGQYYNEYYPRNVIGMAPPLYEDAVEYQDGTPATVDQMAKDVTAFLTWASEPTMEERKNTGIKIILFLIFMTAVFYAVKRKVWSDLH